MIIAIAMTVLISFASSAANLVGQWKGNLKVGQQLVPIIFNVAQTSNNLSATMDSPLQGAKGIPVKSLEVNGSKVAFYIAAAGARYEANFEGGKLVGTWNQNGQSFPLKMQQGGGADAKAETTVAVKKN